MNEHFKLPMILNQNNALIVNLLESYKKSILSTFWHKFIIHEGASLDSKQILKSIVKNGGDIFPIQYEIEGENATFIARNCTKAIENLCARNLILKYNEEKPSVILSIHVNKGIPNKTTLTIQDVIARVIKKRYKTETGVLDLENFVDDPDLHGKVHCAINQLKVLMFVLSLANGLHVKCLRLNNNEMTNISGLDVMADCTFRFLHSIDLRNNLIYHFSELNLLKKFNITELWLDGNPICKDYENYGYVLNVKKICPKIEKLDGEELLKNGIPISCRNYLIKYSSLNLVDQFLEHYFNLYDTNRESLIDLYHSEALFSLTTSLIPDQITSSTKRLVEFQRINRNLLNKNNSPKYEKWLYHSGEDIVKILCKLSASEHDPYSFTVDVLYHSDETIVISVTGVFRERNDYDSKNLLNFSRNFVLLASPGGDYHIINEQLYISNATTTQVKSTFQNFDEVKSKTYTDGEQLCLIKTMVEICEIDVDIAKRLLKITKWDLKSSLKIFMNQSIQQLITLSNQPISPKSHSSSQIPNYIPNQSVQQLMISQQASLDTHPSWNNFNQVLNPPNSILNLSLEPSNEPFGFSNPFAAISDSSTRVPNTSFEITYAPPEAQILPYVIPYQPDGISNLFHEIPNQFFIPPQSSQITSTTNELIPKVSDNLISIKTKNRIRRKPTDKRNAVLAKKQKAAYTVTAKKPEVTNISLAEKMGCDICLFVECHRRDCPKYLSNKGVLKNEKTIAKTNRNRCRLCLRRGHLTGSCLKDVTKSATSSMNSNKDGDVKELDEGSKNILSAEDCSELLKKLSQQKNKIVLNLKSNKELTSETIKSSNTQEILKDIFETIESTKTEKISNTEGALKKPSEILQTTSENNDSIKKQPETSCMITDATKQQSDILRTIPEVNEILSYKNCKEEEASSQGNKQYSNSPFQVFDVGKSFKMKQGVVYTSTNMSTIPDDQKTLICDYCGYKGHSVYYCSVLVKVLNKSGRSNTPQIKSNGSRVMICAYCGKNGHLKSYCRTLLAEMFKIVVENKNSENLLCTTEDGKTILLCDFCKKSAHLKRYCPILKNKLTVLTSRNVKINPKSEISGPSGQQNISCEKNSNELAITCLYCRKKGHKLEDCLQQKIDKSVIFIN